MNRMIPDVADLEISPRRQGNALRLFSDSDRQRLAHLELCRRPALDHNDRRSDMAMVNGVMQSENGP